MTREGQLQFPNQMMTCHHLCLFEVFHCVLMCAVLLLDVFVIQHRSDGWLVSFYWIVWGIGWASQAKTMVRATTGVGRMRLTKRVVSLQEAMRFFDRVDREGFSVCFQIVGIVSREQIIGGLLWWVKFWWFALHIIYTSHYSIQYSLHPFSRPVTFDSPRADALYV